MAPYAVAAGTPGPGGGTTYVGRFRRRRRSRAEPAAEVQPPIKAEGAAAGAGELCGQQQVAAIGQPAPIVFARRVGSRGGVMLAPRATDARFTNDASNNLTASYHLILGDGPMGSLQVRDVFQCTCRVGSFTQTYNRRAGNWSPGNNLVTRAGYTLQDVPDYCGSKGTAEGLSTLSYENTYPDGSSDWSKQVHAFCRSGRTVTRLADSVSGPSSNFADVFKLAMKISDKLPADMIDTTRLQTAALFLDANQLYCDIEVKDSNNLSDFVSEIAPYLLLRETRVNGKRGLRPLLPIDAGYAIRTDAIPWEFEFDEDFILPGSVQIDYTPLEQRKPVLMTALWRQQPDDSFGIVQTAEVGYAFDRNSGNVEQHDMSPFCTHELHAVRAMAYRRSRRRWSTHTATWACRPEVYNRILEEGDIVRLTFTRTASDGSSSTHDYLYQLDQITKTPTGEIEFIGTHFPIDSTGRSMIALDVMAAQASGHTYTGIRTGLDCDDDSSGDRATDTSVPAEVGEIVSPGAPPAPPATPPSLPPVPTPPGGPEPTQPPPPGGYPPPTSPPAPIPTPPDTIPVDPCATDCTTVSRCGPGAACLPGETNVGTITAHKPDGDETCQLCQTCEPSADPNCYPLDCCGPAQIAAGYKCSTYADIIFGYIHPTQGFTSYATVRTKDGSYSYVGSIVYHVNTCGVSTSAAIGAAPENAATQRVPATGFNTSCFPCA